jgi:hypothetical protein
MDKYDPHAITASEQELKLIADLHPEHREALYRAIGLMSSTWARLALVRQAVK